MIFSPVERWIAGRYLRPRRAEGFVSVIAGFSLTGIALGVATLIVVMSVMNGFRAELLDRILGINGHLGVYPKAAFMGAYDDAAARLKQIKGVSFVTPLLEGQVMVTANNRAMGAVVRGIRDDDFNARPVLREAVVGGGFPGGDEEQQQVVIGARLAEMLGVGIGDKVVLIAPQGKVTAFGTMPRMRGYRIAGLFDVGMFEYDSSFIFMPLPAAQVFFRAGEKAGHLEVVLDDAAATDRAAADIAALLGREGIRLLDWREANKSFFSAIEVERNVMFLILTLIIVVAAFNIISGLIMLVKDKGRDIAILRTMGAGRTMVLRIFFLSGASIGIAGTLLGLVLGVLFAANIDSIRLWLERFADIELWSAEIRFLSQLPSVIDPLQVVLVAAMGLGLSFLATLYPSWRAARIDPVEALRYE